MQKRLDGRGEPILEPGLPIIDTQHHLFDRPSGRYMFEDYLADVRLGHDVVASVYVETQAMARADGPEWRRPLGEIEFANGVAAMAASGTYGPCRVAAAIVGHADLRAGDAIAAYLDEAVAAAPARFRGVRQIAMAHADPGALRFLTHPPPAGLLDHPRFRLGFRHLAARRLSFDAAVFHTQLPDVASLADAFPDTAIILNHIGLPLAMDRAGTEREAVFTAWRRNLRDLARRPNVLCKIGGLGTAYWGFGFNEREGPASSAELADAWRPFVAEGVDAFGAERCMAESDFPADGRSCGFVPLWNALKRILAGCSATDKAAIFHGTAARAYRIDLPATQ